METTYSLPKRLREIIDKNFLIINPSGEKIEGFSGFIFWCEEHAVPVEETAREYLAILKKYDRYKKDGLIDGMFRIKSTFADIYLDQLYHLDFYSMERYGKTKLGASLFHAKQSQNKGLIKELVFEIKPTVELFLKKKKIDAVGFIPPTIERKVQFMKEMENDLQLSLPVILLTKVETSIITPQKTLTKKKDRMGNAQKTIMVGDAKKYKTVLLLDDATVSCATMNETAKKLKQQGIAQKVVGLSIVGSFSGVETVGEV